MRVGHMTSASCQKMEYYFIPDTNKPVLLVAYECVLQNGDHQWHQNPAITIQVFQSTNSSNTSFETTPINLGYYPTDYMTNGNNNPNPSPNQNWPYSRYHFVQDGYLNSSTPDPNPPSPNYCTPSRWWNESNLGITRCGGYGNYTSHKYVIVAFNLTEQARNHRAVKFQIIMRGCYASAHGAYLYYSAKMVPGKIEIDACPQMDTVELKVPWGFDAQKYIWKHGINENLVTNMPSTGNPYKVKIPRDQLMPYYRCEMESETGVPFVYEAKSTLYEFNSNFTYMDTAGNCKHNLVFHNTSLNQIITPAFVAGNYNIPEVRVNDPSPRLNWSWIKSAGDTVQLGNANDTVVGYTFDADLDSVQIMLRVNTSKTNACQPYDTVIWVKFDTANVICPVTRDTIQICESSMVNGKYQRTIADSTYTWEYDHQIQAVVFRDSAWNGCDSIVKMLLLIEKPKVNVSSQKDYCDEFETTLETDKDGPDYRWEWSTGDTNSLLHIDRAGTYSVTVTDKNSGCKASGSIVIPTCKPFVNLVNAITPSDLNGKNPGNPTNDCFTIPQWKLIKYVEFSVFTRTGELIYSFKGDPKDLKWCGTRGNTDHPVEYNQVYPYILKYKDLDGVSKVIKSTITVL